MLNRRSLLAVSLSTAIAVPARAAPDSFAGFLAGMRAEARRAGISAATLDRAFAGVQPTGSGPAIVDLMEAEARDRASPAANYAGARCG